MLKKFFFPKQKLQLISWEYIFTSVITTMQSVKTYLGEKINEQDNLLAFE